MDGTPNWPMPSLSMFLDPEIKSLLIDVASWPFARITISLKNFRSPNHSSYYEI